MYVISQYTKQKARANNLEVKPSVKPFKKIDVFNSGNYITSIGDNRYADYPTYLEVKGKTFADKRKKLYHIRHKKDKGQAGKLAKLLLW